MPGNRRHLPPETKEQIVEMYKARPSLTCPEIARTLGVGDSTVSRTLRVWRQKVAESLSEDTETLGNVPMKATRGRPRLLDEGEVQFLEGCVERSPNIHFTELREELRQHTGTEVSETTILRALRRRGHRKSRHFEDANASELDGSGSTGLSSCNASVTDGADLRERGGDAALPDKARAAVRLPPNNKEIKGPGKRDILLPSTDSDSDHGESYRPSGCQNNHRGSM